MLLEAEVRASAQDVVANTLRDVEAGRLAMSAEEQSLIRRIASTAKKAPWYLPLITERRSAVSRGFVLGAVGALILAAIAVYSAVPMHFVIVPSSGQAIGGTVEIVAVLLGAVFASAAVIWVISELQVLSGRLKGFSTTYGDRVTSAALTLDPDAVFRKTRKRLLFAYRLRLSIAITLAAVFVVGLAGEIAGVLSGRLPLAIAAGGTAFLSLLGAWVFQPFDRLREVVRDTSELSAIEATASEMLKLSRRVDTLEDQIERNQEIWAVVTPHWPLRTDVQGAYRTVTRLQESQDYDLAVTIGRELRLARIAGAYRMWAQRHPRRGKPLIFVGDGRSLTPEDLADEVAKRTPIGKSQIQAIELLTKGEEGLDGALAILVNSVDLPALPAVGEPDGPQIPPFGHHTVDAR